MAWLQIRIKNIKLNKIAITLPTIILAFSINHDQYKLYQEQQLPYAVSERIQEQIFRIR